MPRAAKAYSDNASPIDPDTAPPDNLPGGQQRVVRMPASLTHAPTTAPASVFAMGQQAKAAHNRGRRRLPALDESALQVHANLPPPFSVQQRGRTKYDPIFSKLTADGMAVTGIPRAYYGGLTKAIDKANTRLPAGSRFIVRTLDSATLGVFRVKAAPKG